MPIGKTHRMSSLPSERSIQDHTISLGLRMRNVGWENVDRKNEMNPKFGYAT
jgi:hypothetical protein